MTIPKPPMIFCPLCGNPTLQHIEECEANEGERKDSWTCPCDDAERVGLILYTYTFPVAGQEKTKAKTSEPVRRVVLTTGEELDEPEPRDDGVLTDAGIIPWHLVAGFRTWHKPTRQWMFAPK